MLKSALKIAEFPADVVISTITLFSMLHFLPKPIERILRSALEIALLTAFFICIPTFATAALSAQLSHTALSGALATLFTTLCLCILLQPDHLFSIPHQLHMLCQGPHFHSSLDGRTFSTLLLNTLKLLLYITRFALLSVLALIYVAPFYPPALGLITSCLNYCSLLSTHNPLSPLLALASRYFPQTTHNIMIHLGKISLSCGMLYTAFTADTFLVSLGIALTTPQLFWMPALLAATLTQQSILSLQRRLFDTETFTSTSCEPPAILTFENHHSGVSQKQSQRVSLREGQAPNSSLIRA